jgi:hypothetical protein
MQVTLSRSGQVLVVPLPWYVALIDLAIEYGWQPSPASWSDCDEALCELFLGRVTAEDALALADALEDALLDIPSHNALSHRERRLVPDDNSAGGPYLSCPPSLYEWFSGRNRRMVLDLIAFARGGAFEVMGPPA